MPGPSTSVPFVSDEEDQDEDYRAPQQDEDDAATGKSGGNYGPSGGGKGDDGRSQMPTSTAASANPDEEMLVAPKYQAPDRTALNTARGKLTTDSAAVKQADYKPKWWERLLGGVAGGLSQDAEGGAAVTNRRFNQAVGQQKRNVAADTEAVNTEQGKVDASGQDFERNLQAFGGQARAANANSLTGERAAKAAKYENALDPNSFKQGEDGTWTATSYGGKTSEVDAPKWARPKAPPTPKTYEELKEAANDPQYSTEQRAGFAKSAKEIEGSEVRKFSQTAPRASEGEIQYRDWRTSFQRDNGRPPNAQEINAYRRNESASGSGNRTDFKNPEEATKWKDNAVTTQQQNYDTSRRRILASDDPDKNKKIADLDRDNEAKKKDIQGSYTSALAQFNPQRGQPGSAARTAAPPAAQRGAPRQFKAPKSGHQLSVGQQVNVPGKGVRYVTGYVNGKVQVTDKKPGA